MNLNNRRLKEIRAEKLVWQDQLNKAESISDCFTFKGKLDILEKEERKILERNGVKL